MTGLQHALDVTDLTVVLGGQKVVDVPSLHINPNEVFVIVGPNGSGKTTLLLCLALLLRPASGRIVYGTSSPRAPSRLGIRRETSVVFQEPLLLDRSVRDNVNLGQRLRGVSRKDIPARTSKWLTRFGVAHLADRQARLLSGGEAKRISLARAFALEPRILFLDEPFNALDTPTRQALLEEFESVLRETRMTTVMVTHDHNEAQVLAHRMAVLVRGKIHQVGTPHEVFSFPADEEVAAFVESGNILHGAVSRQSDGIGTVNVGGEQLLQVVSDLAPETRVTAFIRYEDVTIATAHPESGMSSARNQLKGTIVKAFAFGPQLRVTIDCGFKLSSVITRRSWEEMGLEVGTQVTASFKASSVYLIPRL